MFDATPFLQVSHEGNVAFYKSLTPFGCKSQQLQDMFDQRVQNDIGKPEGNVQQNTKDAQQSESNRCYLASFRYCWNLPD